MSASSQILGEVPGMPSILPKDCKAVGYALQKVGGVLIQTTRALSVPGLR
jgi:hypothetical protein